VIERRVLGSGEPTFDVRHVEVEGSRAWLRAFPFDATGRNEARVQREVDALRTLDHPSILKLEDWGSDHEMGALFLCTSRIDGVRVRDQLLDGPMSWRRACRAVYPIAKALQHCHEHGLVHRDVHPGQIYLPDDGLPMLIGWGLSLDARRLTELAYAPLGELGYLAPETIARKDYIGARADLYGLGVTLYEALTGKPAFPAAALGGAVDQAEHMLEWKARTAALDPGDTVPSWLRQLVRKATDPDTEKRLPDMEAFMGWLDAAQSQWAIPDAATQAAMDLPEVVPGPSIAAPPPTLVLRPSIGPARTPPPPAEPLPEVVEPTAEVAPPAVSVPVPSAAVPLVDTSPEPPPVTVPVPSSAVASVAPPAEPTPAVVSPAVVLPAAAVGVAPASAATVATSAVEAPVPAEAPPGPSEPPDPVHAETVVDIGTATPVAAVVTREDTDRLPDRIGQDTTDPAPAMFVNDVPDVDRTVPSGPPVEQWFSDEVPIPPAAEAQHVDVSAVSIATSTAKPGGVPVPVVVGGITMVLFAAVVLIAMLGPGSNDTPDALVAAPTPDPPAVEAPVAEQPIVEPPTEAVPVEPPAEEPEIEEPVARPAGPSVAPRPVVAAPEPVPEPEVVVAPPPAPEPPAPEVTGPDPNDVRPVLIRADGYAGWRLWVDGEKVGKLPVSVPLGEGQHRFELRGKAKDRDVTVRRMVRHGPSGQLDLAIGAL
jgi:serine/threonine-protein kinase